MKKLIIPILALTVVLTSCQLNNNLEQVSGNQAVTFVHAGTKIDPNADNVFVANDKIGITMTETGKTAPKTENNLYTYGTTVFTATEADVIRFPDVAEYDFYAYYPFKGTSKTGAPVVLSVAAQDGTNNKDLFALRAVAQGETKTNRSEIPLTFKRLTSKITFSITKGQGVDNLSNLTQVVLKNFVSENTLDVVNGTFSNTKNEDITGTLSGSESSGSGIVYILATAAADNLEFVFILDGKEYSCPLPINTEFAAAKNYTYKVTISSSEVTAVPTIEAWTTEDKGSIDAER